jgi:tetratricopeptide (TPR) repeat protein
MYHEFEKFVLALECYSNCIELLKNVIENNFENENYKTEIADSYFSAAKIYSKLGNLNQSFDYLIKYNQFLKELSEKNINQKILLSISYGELGEVCQQLENFDLAIEYFKLLEKSFNDLNRNNLENENIKQGLALSYEKLGGIYQKIGNIKETLKYFKEESRIYEELCESNPNNPPFKNSLLISYEKLGDIYFKQGLYEEAKKVYQDSFKYIQQQLNKSPNDKTWHRELAFIFNRFGKLYAEQSDLEACEKAYKESLTINEYLTAEEPNNANNQRDLCDAYWCMVEFCEKTGSPKITNWYQKAHNTLNYMKEHGLDMNAQDEEYLEIVKGKLFGEE